MRARCYWIDWFTSHLVFRCPSNCLHLVTCWGIFMLHWQIRAYYIAVISLCIEFERFMIKKPAVMFDGSCIRYSNSTFIDWGVVTFQKEKLIQEKWFPCQRYNLLQEMIAGEIIAQQTLLIGFTIPSLGQSLVPTIGRGWRYPLTWSTVFSE